MVCPARFEGKKILEKRIIGQKVLLYQFILINFINGYVIINFYHLSTIPSNIFCSSEPDSRNLDILGPSNVSRDFIQAF